MNREIANIGVAFHGFSERPRFFALQGDGKPDQNIRIEVVRPANTDLLMAFSDDLPGLLVSARSEDELDWRLPGAIREIIEAGEVELCHSMEPT